WSARLRACTRLSSGIVGTERLQRSGGFELAPEVGRQLGERELEDLFERTRPGGGDRGPHRRQLLAHVCLDLFQEAVAGEVLGLEEAAVAVDRVSAPPTVDLVLVAVAAGIVGGGVRADAVSESFDQ